MKCPLLCATRGYLGTSGVRVTWTKGWETGCDPPVYGHYRELPLLLAGETLNASFPLKDKSQGFSFDPWCWIRSQQKEGPGGRCSIATEQSALEKCWETISNFTLWFSLSSSPRELLLPSNAAAVAATCLLCRISVAAVCMALQIPESLAFQRVCYHVLSLSPGRRQWCPRLAGSSGCSEESLLLPTGSSFTITRISGSCIWSPKLGSKSSK